MLPQAILCLMCLSQCKGVSSGIDIGGLANASLLLLAASTDRAPVGKCERIHVQVSSEDSRLMCTGYVRGVHTPYTSAGMSVSTSAAAAVRTQVASLLIRSSGSRETTSTHGWVWAVRGIGPLAEARPPLTLLGHGAGRTMMFLDGLVLAASSWPIPRFLSHLTPRFPNAFDLVQLSLDVTRRSVWDRTFQQSAIHCACGIPICVPYGSSPRVSLSNRSRVISHRLNTALMGPTSYLRCAIVAGFFKCNPGVIVRGSAQVSCHRGSLKPPKGSDACKISRKKCFLAALTAPDLFEH
ncbi:hypothetical protein C8R45DRAFT_1075179 [Mycena sanguinolenta]|nr:hypothetical protein C8R45DRAFT_1075179 [Mycena sanguinolenta]